MVKPEIKVERRFDISLTLSGELFDALEKIASTPCRCIRGYENEIGNIIPDSEPEPCTQLRALLLKAIDESKK